MPKNPFEHYDGRFTDTELQEAKDKKEKSLKEKTEDETRLGIPSADESVVHDWLRSRIDISDDMLQGRAVFKVETSKQPEGEYELELKKLKSLSKTELEMLLRAVEKQSKEGRGIYSKGNLLHGYAIDPVTLQSIDTIHHDNPEMDLAHNIARNVPAPKGKHPLNYFQDIMRRSAKGFIYLKVPDYKIQIVKLYFGVEEFGNRIPNKDINKIISFLKHEKKYLPVSSEFEVL